MSRGYLLDIDRPAVFINNNAFAKEQNTCVVVRSAQNLIERYGFVGVCNVARLFGVKIKVKEVMSGGDMLLREEVDMSSHEVAAQLWAKFKELTDEQKKHARRLKREARGESTGESRKSGFGCSGPGRAKRPRDYRICFKEIGQELHPTRRSKLPKQATIILDYLRQQPLETFTEPMMEDFVNNLAEQGILVGRGGKPLAQKPWRIFEYYSPLFHQLGLVLRRYTDGI